MSYLDNGYNEFLQRIEPSANQGGGASELDAQEFDHFTQQLSGDKIQGGILLSPDGRIRLDLDEGAFKVSNGVQDLVQFGVLPDGTVGLLIKDNQGNTLMQIAEGTMFLQSSNKAVKLDFIAEQFDIRDQYANLRVRLGKDPNGF